MTRRITWTLVASALLGTACGVPVGRAFPSHRAGAPIWVTTGISEGGDSVRVTVRTREPERARDVAARIINQRRAQSWRVIEVAVQDEQGRDVTLIASTTPHPADSLRDD